MEWNDNRLNTEEYNIFNAPEETVTENTILKRDIKFFITINKTVVLSNKIFKQPNKHEMRVSKIGEGKR